MSDLACKQTFASQALSSLLDQFPKFGDGFQMSALHPTPEVCDRDVVIGLRPRAH